MQRKSEKVGALPSQVIHEMMEAGFITGGKEENVRPASLDLAVSDEIYAVEGIFQPRVNETIRDVLKLVKKEKHDLSRPLEKGQVYLARLSEELDLPESVYGYCNPKSTSGRLDLHVRVLADRVSRYDSISPRGWKGELWLVILPNSFSIKIKEGQTLSQVRFFNGDTRFDEFELELSMKRNKLLWNAEGRKELSYKDMSARDGDGYILLTLGLDTKIAGYRGVPSSEVIDVSKVGEYTPEQFFEPLAIEDGQVSLKRGEFYILSTAENVRVPPELTCEMVPMDERSGDFRSHYAGFIDPGWGYGENGEGVGRPLTLEVRPFEDIVARHGQPIAKIRFEKVREVPEISYDTLGSNYLEQAGPKLAKQFKSTL